MVPRGEARWAWLLSDGGEPRNWMLLLAPLLGWRADGWVGIGWGVVAAVFTGVLPTLILRFGARRRYWGDRHVRRRQDRIAAAPGVMASVLTGTALLYGFDAPVEVTALVTAMVAVLLALMVITFFWKVSVHGAVAGGSLGVLMTVFGPWMLMLSPLVALIGWSRVRLCCHTVGQVAVGMLVGVAVGVPVYTLLGGGR
ncbi:hypothetical protein DN069_17715 [Streptacidiphilus pinicola]|uniref:Phosphoesterase PA-phosphatase n=1 Tax=Streptacidiphilus pinicola TaxID=2219663 RepID=A0A2X0K4Y1_9ACTN|nr:hypothetical protein [Streptacidiphilus pinicola]RAG84325.1 hypothetical protein DN069_17715 [Streptacidiphilus pinicola]